MEESAYKKAGVDIEAGAALVEDIKPHVRKTARSGIVSDLGGFGAFFDPAQAGYKDPLLVSATDGVGTKIRVAIDAGRHDTIGQDLVAMCVNDIIVQGAEPLFFLDYFATGRLDRAIAAQVIAGIAEGCALAGCALIGGETAEMPGMYQDGDYDLAGFAVGAVDRDKVIDGRRISDGDVILGLVSSGPHSNGYSLIRRIVKESGLSYDDPSPYAPETTLGESLLSPTIIYTAALMAVIRQGYRQHDRPIIKGLAHITGGGLLENIPRILPDGVKAVLDAGRWTLPPCFGWLAAAGGLSADDMARTFNCGIGMALLCAEKDADFITRILKTQTIKAVPIGTVAPCEGEEPPISIAQDHYLLGGETQ